MTRSLQQAIIGELNLTGTPDASDVRWDAFSKREWRHALDWMDLSGLAIYFTDRIRLSNRLETLPVEVRSDLDKRCSANAVRT